MGVVFEGEISRLSSYVNTFLATEFNDVFFCFRLVPRDQKKETKTERRGEAPPPPHPCVRFRNPLPSRRCWRSTRQPRKPKLSTSDQTALGLAHVPPPSYLLLPPFRTNLTNTFLLLCLNRANSFFCIGKIFSTKSSKTFLFSRYFSGGKPPFLRGKTQTGQNFGT